MSKSPAVYAIPVRSYVRQYMLLWYGQQQPHALHQNTFLGRFVRMKLEKQPFRQLQRPERPQGPAFELTLPTALKHYTLTPEAARQLGEAFDKLFQEKMLSYVVGQVAATGNERAALRSFCNLYHIDPDEADLEVLRKCYRDYKDRVLKANNMLDLLYTPGGREDLFSDFALAS